MKRNFKSRFLLALSCIVIALVSISTLAFTYPSSGSRTSSGSSSWIFIPLVVLAIGAGALVYTQRRRASKEANKAKSGDIKVSTVIQQKLLPDEKPIGQLNNGRADFVATNKRLLRFSSGGFQPLDYVQISDVSYKTSSSKKLAARVAIGLCMIVMLLITIFIWISAFDESVRNVSITDAIIITVVAAGIGVIGFMAATRDFGFYQVESTAYDKANLKSWQITRPPAYFGNANVDEFVKTVKEQLKT